MPQIRVGMWNIQNFGAVKPDYRGANDQLLANVIRDLVRYLQLDVLLIIEVLPAAGPSLQALVNTLNAGIPGGNADWKFDWIKGSIDFGSPYPPVAPGTLSWRGGPGSPRVEGYAIFWRSNQAAKYTIVPAMRNASEGSFPGVVGHYLELVTEGLDFEYQDEQHWWVASAYNPATNATLPIDNNQAAAAWQTLNFPWVSVGRFAQPRQFLSRRPAYAILNLNIAGATQANRLLPLIFYHAPSNQTRAEMGTFIAALTKQINVSHQLDGGGNQIPALTRVNKAIIGGDFNWRRGNPPDFVYSKYVDPYQNNILAGGSNLTFDSLHTDNTTVQIQDFQNGRFNGNPITTNNNGDYYWLPIDQLMYRGLTQVAAASGVVNMLNILRMNPSPLRASMAAYRQHFQNMINNSGWVPDATWGPLQGVIGLPTFGTRFTNWNSFYADLGLPNASRRFRTARSAAEFMHIFVSDHLPLVVTFNT